MNGSIYSKKKKVTNLHYHSESSIHLNYYDSHRLKSYYFRTSPMISCKTHALIMVRDTKKITREGDKERSIST